MSGRLAGLDVGGTFLKTVVLEDGQVVASARHLQVPSTDVLGFVVSEAADLVSRHGVEAVGVGVAGLVSWPDGEFVWGPHVAGQAVPYRAELERRLRIPVVVDNDANLAALTEATLGAGRGYDPVLMLTFGTGIGGGLVIGGEIYHGRSFAGEFGHMTMVPDGPACACGARGCWETLVSGAVLGAAARVMVRDDPAGAVARVAAGSVPSGAHLMEAAKAGDAKAQDVFTTAGRWLGRGLVNLMVALDPAVIVVGGAMADAGDIVLEAARAQVREMLPGIDHRQVAPVVTASHGALAGAVGAALAAGRSMDRT